MDRREYLGVLGAVVGGLSAETAVAGTLAPEVDQGQRITPDDGEPGDEFAERVALGADGTTLLVTTQSDADLNGDLAGSAYLFDRTDSGFVQRAKFGPDDGDSGDFFGIGGVGMSDDGTTMFVGALNDEDPNGQLAGSGYVFDRVQSGVVQRDKIAAPDGRERDRFGNDGAVSPDGDTVVVGAPGREGPDGGQLAGVAFVFERTDGGFTHDATLSPSAVDGQDKYGVAVAVTSRHVFVGASGYDDTGDDTTGSVYVYDRTEDPPELRRELTASESGTDGFGNVLAVRGDALAVGVGGALDGDGAAVGGVDLYRRTDGRFERVDGWVRPEGTASDTFPKSVSLDESTVVVGGANTGYAVTREPGGLGDTTRLRRERDDAGDDFGNSVTVDDGTVVVGAPDDEDPNGSEAGTAYVFDAGPGALAAAFDDGNGAIEAREVLRVIAAFNDSDDDRVQEARTVLAVIGEYNGDGRWANVGPDT